MQKKNSLLKNNISRRNFIKITTVLPLLIFVEKIAMGKTIHEPFSLKKSNKLGIDRDGYSHIYVSRNRTPEENMKIVLEMMGGIKSIIDKEDIVILKPNAQWWNQGMTNTDAMKAFIEEVLAMPGFKGEIIIAENHHFPEDNSRGWTTQYRNGKFNYNELIQYFNDKGYHNVTKYHWHDGGPSRQPSWGGAENGGLVDGPDEGDGYKWCYDLVYTAPTGRKCLMNYPIFTSSYSKIRIDFKNGAWKDGKYIDKPVKFINFSALNHHGQTGVTASIKNYLGIVDMTCGYRGLRPEGYHNFHSIGFSNLTKISFILSRLGWKFYGPYIGGAVGMFMKTVRMADLNIITAEWVGWGSRTDLSKRAHTKTILASRDPIALDYYAAKYVLLPATPREGESHYYRFNDPDNTDSPFQKFLQSCHKQGIGNLDEKRFRIHLQAFG